MFKKLNAKLDAWALKEQRELDNFVCGKIRDQWKKDCPELFGGEFGGKKK